jgi:hypothetical protein
VVLLASFRLPPHYYANLRNQALGDSLFFSIRNTELKNITTVAFANAASPLNWYEVAKLMHENAIILHKSEQGYVSYSVPNEAKKLLVGFLIDPYFF